MASPTTLCLTFTLAMMPAFQLKKMLLKYLMNMYREKQMKKTVKLEGGYRVFQFVVVVGGIRHRGCRSPLSWAVSFSRLSSTST